MTTATKEQAVEVLRLLTAVHANEAYYKKASVVSGDLGWCVDLYVDREKWQAANQSGPGLMDGVPVCVMLVG